MSLCSVIIHIVQQNNIKLQHVNTSCDDPYHANGDVQLQRPKHPLDGPVKMQQLLQECKKKVTLQEHNIDKIIQVCKSTTLKKCVMEWPFWATVLNK